MNIVVTGCGKVDSLGHMIAMELHRCGHRVLGTYLDPVDTSESMDGQETPYRLVQCDLRWADAGLHLVEAADNFFFTWVDVVINCAGINRIAELDDVDIADWDATMEVNARSIMLLAKSFHRHLRMSKGTILNIVSNASHMPMRHSLAYNASKAAAHMMTLQLARELADRDITVFAISPNKLAGTGMSKDIDQQVCETRKWTMEEAQAYQRKSLLAGVETPPQMVAEFVSFLLQDKEHHRYLTGCDIPYGA